MKHVSIFLNGKFRSNLVVRKAPGIGHFDISQFLPLVESKSIQNRRYTNQWSGNSNRIHNPINGQQSSSSSSRSNKTNVDIHVLPSTNVSSDEDQPYASNQGIAVTTKYDSSSSSSVANGHRLNGSNPTTAAIKSVSFDTKITHLCPATQQYETPVSHDMIIDY